MAPFHDNLDRATLDLLDRAFTDVWAHFRSKQSSNISMASEQATMRERVRELGVCDLERLKRHALFHLEAGEIRKRKVLHLPL
jgi:hypothetical protein